MSQYHHPKKSGSLCSCQIVSGNTDKKGKGIFHWEIHENATLIKEVDFFRFVLHLILTWQHSIIFIKEARKGFLGCYSVCERMKDTKEGYFIV